MSNEYDEDLEEDYDEDYDALLQAIDSQDPIAIRDQAIKQLMASGGEMIIAQTMIDSKFAKDSPYHKMAMSMVQGISAFRTARATKALLDSYDMKNAPEKE